MLCRILLISEMVEYKINQITLAEDKFGTYCLCCSQNVSRFFARFRHAFAGSTQLVIDKIFSPFGAEYKKVKFLIRVNRRQTLRFSRIMMARGQGKSGTYLSQI